MMRNQSVLLRCFVLGILCHCTFTSAMDYDECLSPRRNPQGTRRQSGELYPNVQDDFEGLPKLRIPMHMAEVYIDGMDPAAQALHEAVFDGNVSEVDQILKEHPAMVNATDPMERTPLHIAAMRGNKDVFELLLRRGANRELAHRLADQNPLLMEVLKRLERHPRRPRRLAPWAHRFCQACVDRRIREAAQTIASEQELHLHLIETDRLVIAE